MNPRFCTDEEMKIRIKWLASKGCEISPEQFKRLANTVAGGMEEVERVSNKDDRRVMDRVIEICVFNFDEWLNLT